MRFRIGLLAARVSVVLRVVVAIAFLGAMALGVAAPDDWGYGGWIPRFKH